MACCAHIIDFESAKQHESELIRRGMWAFYYLSDYPCVVDEMLPSWEIHATPDGSGVGDAIWVIRDVLDLCIRMACVTELTEKEILLALSMLSADPVALQLAVGSGDGALRLFARSITERHRG